jgi:hypothetical protein
MTKVELLKHILANVEAGRGCFNGLTYHGSADVYDVYTSPIEAVLRLCSNFSTAPRTRVINGYTVPAPMKDKPKHGEIYYLESSSCLTWYHTDVWANYQIDKHRFAIGIHATAEAAAANCQARHGVDPEWKK